MFPRLFNRMTAAAHRHLRARTPASLAALGFVVLLPTASCVPSASALAPRSAATAPVDPTVVAANVQAIESFTAPPANTDPAMTTAPGQAPAVPPGAAPAINAAIPFAGGPNPAAAAFFQRQGTATDHQRSLQCLTEAVYYEAASESDDGQRAVAQVVLNRMRHPAYPASVCGVVYQNAERWLACQFSFACDGARARVPSANGWGRARAIAAQALAGRVYAPVGLATHYHTWNVVPFWAHKLEKTAVVGAHIFYRLNGVLGRGGAFSQRYAGAEPLPTPARFAPTLATPEVALVPILPVQLGELAALAPAKPSVRTDATPAPAETLTVPKPVMSPIMKAVEGSTVREEFKDSGTIKPEFAKR